MKIIIIIVMIMLTIHSNHNYNQTSSNSNNGAGPLGNHRPLEVDAPALVELALLGWHYAQLPYSHYPYRDCLTQTFRGTPSGPGNATP